MTEPSRFAGQRSQPALFHRQGRAASGFGKNHPRFTPVFIPKTLPVEADCKKLPENGNGIPTKTGRL